MICPNCELRWAPFPEGDFAFTNGKFIPLHGYAELQRRAVWNFDKPELCPGCKEDLERTFVFSHPEP